MKRVLRVILFSLISLLLLTSMLITAMFGNVKAEYFKSLSTSLDFEAVPDLALEYYIKDGNNSSGKQGMYGETKNIQQTIKTLATPGNTIYQIKIPVSEVGFYTLSFKVDFWKGTSFGTDFYVRTFDTPVGCQVLHPVHLAFGTATALSMAPDDTTAGNYSYGVRRKWSSTNLFAAYNHYQWKTLAPSRAENVDLTFSVVASDVTNGYVNWCWEFTGLTASTAYTLNLNNIKLTKNEVNEGDPYFEFMRTQYVNNAVYPDTNTTGNNGGWHGVTTSGYTRFNRARGTYVTDATYNSMTMQINPLFVCWSNSGDGRFLTGTTGESYSNVVVINVPMKNIKKDTTYRVSFDLSVAKQGNADSHGHDLPLDGYEYVGNTNISYSHGALAAKDVNYSTTYNQMFNSVTGGCKLAFQSYLHGGAVTNRTTSYLSGENGRQQVTSQNKYYSAHELTRYDEIMNIASSTAVDPTCAYTTAHANSTQSHATALNSGVTQSYKKGFGDGGGGGGINWFNAIRHTEINGENKINWLTFYNTSFTFNIPTSEADVTVGTDGYCNNLFWTWAIDAFNQTSWIRVKIENVRIEEVVQYGSFLDTKGMYIGSERCEDFYPNGVNTYVPNCPTTDDADQIITATFRSANGTGQNYQSRGYGGLNWAATNIFGAVYDAGDHNITENDYIIKLSGNCALKGGVDRYVWSVDGGKTWHDTSGGTISDSAGSNVSKFCEKFVDQGRVGITDRTSTYVGDINYDENGFSVNEKNLAGDYIDFVPGRDNVNGRFVNIVLDLSEYRYQQNLNIIFAAVPKSNVALRCEILQIINFNSDKMHRTYTEDIFSDIEVGESAGNKLNARNDASGESTVKFTDMYGIHADTGTYSAEGGYSHRTSVAHAESYDKIRAIFSDFPIKNKIRLTGWAIVEGGIEKYMWSVDGGKTWSDVFAESELTSGAANVPLEQKAYWYDGVNTVETNDPLGNNCVFDVTIDLSAYVGKFLDLILVAKPAGSDALCPVGRVDNVAVYGDPSKPAGELGAGMGSFYVRHREISVGGTLISQPTVDAPDGDKLNRQNKWNIPPSNFNSLAYTIYEPYNVDYMNARKYTKTSNAIAAGGTVTIDGYILCYSGVKEYRYTLDGGNSWTVIDQDVPDHTANSLVNAYSDKTFTLAHDKANSNFCAYNNYGGTPITVTLPSGVTGNKNLRVVAESNAGYIYPILNLPLSIT